VLLLERVHGSGRARAGDPVDLGEIEAVCAQGDLQTGDLGITGSVNRRGGRQHTGQTDERNAAAHESDQFGPRGAAPSWVASEPRT
jgi:hypothetical protein